MYVFDIQLHVNLTNQIILIKISNINAIAILNILAYSKNTTCHCWGTKTQNPQTKITPMPPRLILFLVALLMAANTANASTQRTLNLLRGSEVAVGAELGISDAWVGYKMSKPTRMGLIFRSSGAFRISAGCLSTNILLLRSIRDTFQNLKIKPKLRRSGNLCSPQCPGQQQKLRRSEIFFMPIASSNGSFSILASPSQPQCQVPPSTR
jgi:hypothetical protein